MKLAVKRPKSNRLEWFATGIELVTTFYIVAVSDAFNVHCYLSSSLRVVLESVSRFPDIVLPLRAEVQVAHFDWALSCSGDEPVELRQIWCIGFLCCPEPVNGLSELFLCIAQLVLRGERVEVIAE